MAMKFIPLDGKKEPPASTKMIIFFKDNSWVEAYLKRIEFTGHRKDYVFSDGLSEEYNDATHYLLIEPPKNNQ